MATAGNRRSSAYCSVQWRGLSARARRLQVLHGVGNQLDGRHRVRRWGVTLENEVWRSCSGSGRLTRSPQPLSTRLFKQARGSLALSAAMRGLIAARTAVMTAVAAIDADMRRM